ncbi:MAG: hypothetical protein UW99_C0021G0010 [Candidatus Collierbacteria bacterium GW2011_GWC2_45_15]|uniref:Uncharacterized protein n=1 Tax=Candidatus Collierbacteria bacterium GW2011_GWC2_45_15 TaxID=1618394 RepID=A0A0G1LRU6_9BACT|nr:MAG: hypothetical protein UW99_C0021G0010 [Candidatus Collierbacteria bacterium GW2011_GWC2_45_15]
MYLFQVGRGLQTRGTGEAFGIVGDDLITEGVICADLDVIGVFADEGDETLFHFFGGGFGEGESENGAGVGVGLFENVGNTDREHLSFTGTGTGKNEGGAFDIIHSLALGRIEFAVGQVEGGSGL